MKTLFTVFYIDSIDRPDVETMTKASEAIQNSHRGLVGILDPIELTDRLNDEELDIDDVKGF